MGSIENAQRHYKQHAEQQAAKEAATLANGQKIVTQTVPGTQVTIHSLGMPVQAPIAPQATSAALDPNSVAAKNASMLTAAMQKMGIQVPPIAGQAQPNPGEHVTPASGAGTIITPASNGHVSSNNGQVNIQNMPVEIIAPTEPVVPVVVTTELPTIAVATPTAAPNTAGGTGIAGRWEHGYVEFDSKDAVPPGQKVILELRLQKQLRSFAFIPENGKHFVVGDVSINGKNQLNSPIAADDLGYGHGSTKPAGWAKGEVGELIVITARNRSEKPYIFKGKIEGLVYLPVATAVQQSVEIEED